MQSIDKVVILPNEFAYKKNVCIGQAIRIGVGILILKPFALPDVLIMESLELFLQAVALIIWYFQHYYFLLIIFYLFIILVRILRFSAICIYIYIYMQNVKCKLIRFTLAKTPRYIFFCAASGTFRDISSTKHTN